MTNPTRHAKLRNKLRPCKAILMLLSLLPFVKCKSGMLNTQSPAVVIHFVTAINDLDQPTEHPQSHIVKIGDIIQVEGTVHASVGSSFSVEYDKSAFRTTEQSRYEIPLARRRGTTGGDRKERVLWLEALRTGTFQVVCKGNWRGKTTNVEQYEITVVEKK